MDNLNVVKRLFAAVEQRDGDALLACYTDNVRIEEAASLPYGGTFHGLDGARRHSDLWRRWWLPFKATAWARTMDAQFFDAGEHVFVRWRHRAVAANRQLDEPTLGLYRVARGRVAEATMFHLDSAALLAFLGGTP